MYYEKSGEDAASAVDAEQRRGSAESGRGKETRAVRFSGVQGDNLPLFIRSLARHRIALGANRPRRRRSTACNAISS